MSKEINSKDLVYYFKGPIASIHFGKYWGPLYISGYIKNGETILQDAEEEQKKITNDLREITSGNPKNKSQKQSYTIKNVRTLYDLRQKIIDLLNDNAKIRSEAIYKSKQNETKGKGLKILTPKQMLQRLPIALAQVKAGNNSESLLNEIRQIVYSLYQSKPVTKKIYHHIIKPI